MSVVHVAARNDETAVNHRGKVDLAPRRKHATLGHHVAVEAKARNAAVGKDVETHVRHQTRAFFNRKPILSVPVQLRRQEKRPPRRRVDSSAHPSDGMPKMAARLDASALRCG